MYELIEIIENDATRFLKLKNIDTNKIEECFDDSALVSNLNFNFMQVGQIYDCKIKLLGRPVDNRTDRSVTCRFVSKEITIGHKSLVKVQIDNSQYYISKQKIKDYLSGESFNFDFTRKDLIQVDNVIHADLM